MYTFAHLMKRMNLNEYLLLTVLAVCMAFQSCRNDVFVDGDDYTVTVSERVLQATGGSSVLRFGKGSSPSEYPAVCVYIDSETMYHDIFPMEKVVDRLEFSGELFHMCAEFDAKNNTLSLQLDRSLYTDSVSVRIERQSGALWNVEVIKIAPAPDCEVSAVTFDITNYTEIGTMRLTQRADFVNKSEEKNKISIGIRQQARFRPFYDHDLYLFGDSSPEIPAPVWGDDGIVAGDDKVVISDGGLKEISSSSAVEKRIEYEIPPRSLLRISADIGYTGYSMWTIIKVVNPAFAGFAKEVHGEYLLYVPAEIVCKAQAFNLETGEVIPI